MEKLGATGLFPDGKLSENDEGQLKMAVGKVDGRVILNFGKPISWLGLDKESAIELANLILKKAE